jgi:hypothetical protein
MKFFEFQFLLNKKGSLYFLQSRRDGAVFNNREGKFSRIFYLVVYRSSSPTVESMS